MELRRILVAVKPWQRGLPLTAHHARQLAHRTGAQLQIIGTVFDASAAARGERGEPGARTERERALAAARVELERLACSLRNWSANVTTRTVWGVPAYEGIISAAHDWRADLVVVGTHEPGTTHTRLTDTDWQLIRRAECPVLLVKSPAFAGYKTIIAAVDPVHARREPYGLDHDVLAAAKQFGIAAAEVELVASSAPEAVVAAAVNRRAELVVVGSPQRRGAHLDGPAESVVTGVACDVLIVPAVVEIVCSKVG